MKNYVKIVSLLLLILPGNGCTKDSPEDSCFHGIVLGKIRSGGGGVAISMFESDFSNHIWHDYNHVVEALNIPRDQWTPGKTIYFIARNITDEEKSFIITADGDESEKPIIYVLKYSFNGCP